MAISEEVLCALLTSYSPTESPVVFSLGYGYASAVTRIHQIKFQLMMSSTCVLTVANVRHVLMKVAELCEFNLVNSLSLANGW